MSKIDYVKTLTMVMEFLNKTHIPTICEKLCHGECCCNCYDIETLSIKETPCFLSDNRRLACTVFLCDSLKTVIFSEDERRIYHKVELHIKTELHKQVKGNIYFNAFAKSVQKDIYFDYDVIKVLNKIDCEKVRKQVFGAATLISKILQHPRKHYKDIKFNRNGFRPTYVEFKGACNESEV